MVARCGGRDLVSSPSFQAMDQGQPRPRLPIHHSRRLCADWKMGKRGLRVMSWRSPLSNASTFKTKLLICCNNSKDEHFSAHCRELDHVTAWSFKQCFKNEMPVLGHDGQPLHGERAADAGTTLNERSVVPIFCGTVGDWLFHVEAFEVPHCFSTREICMTN